MDNQPAPSRLVFKIELLILLALLVGIGFLSWQLFDADTQTKIINFPSELISRFGNRSPQTPTENTLPSPSLLPSNTPLPLPEGQQTYRFSFGSQVVGPKVSELTINPLTPRPGETQTITLKASYPDPIETVEIQVITDANSTSHSLAPLPGSNNSIWQGSWKLSDTYLNKYGFRLILKSTATYDDIMWLRH